MISAAELADRLGGRRSGQSYVAPCPAHDDRHPSLSISDSGDQVLVHCHAGCSQESVIEALRNMDLWPQKQERRERSSTMGRRGGERNPSRRSASVQATISHVSTASKKARRHEVTEALPSAGLRLDEYALAKALPADWLRELGLSEVTYQRLPAVRIAYQDVDGNEVSTRFRLALTGENRFRYKAGSKALPYGLWRLNRARAANYVVLGEGESDAQTLWFHGIPALTIPGASSWCEEWASYLDGISIIYVVIEPDAGGEAVMNWLAKSAIRERVRLIKLDDAKDPSELYLADRDRFIERWEAAIKASVSWSAIEEEIAHAKRNAAWVKCADLARQPDILASLVAQLAGLGVVGEDRAAQLLYLITTSRLLDKPLSAAVKGPSSAGKSYTTEAVLKFFPSEAYYALSGMSERALAYSEEPLVHRIMVIYEAAGLSGEFASYLMRSLLSEGCVRYETVEKTGDGLRARLIEREGPTGLIVTTTALSLHPENETRLLSIPVNDTPDQTRRILVAMANEVALPEFDPTPWHNLQEWLAGGERRVVIPFAGALAEAIPPVATRLRRDFGAVLSLIKSHALLHRATRPTDACGRIIATLSDYAAVHALMADLVADGAGATVPPTIRETIEAVVAARHEGKEPLMVSQLAHRLGLDQSTALRRARAAIGRGFLLNLEDRPGRPARLVLGDPLPAEREILPSPEALALAAQQACMVAVEEAGLTTPPPQADVVDDLLEVVI